MHTAHLETVHASVSVDTTRLEQISIDYYQMSVGGSQDWCGGTLPDLLGGTLLCDLSHGAFDLTHPPPCGEQTDACENITFTQLRFRVVTSITF